MYEVGVHEWNKEGEKKRDISALIYLSLNQYIKPIRSVSIYNLFRCTKKRKTVPESWLALSLLLGGG